MTTNNENISYNDFKIICRTCLCRCDVNFSSDSVISNIFYKLTDIHFNTKDEFPQQICLQCFEKINEIHEFAFQCKRSHINLEKIINVNRNMQLNKERVETNKEDEGILLEKNTTKNYQHELIVRLNILENTSKELNDIHNSQDKNDLYAEKGEESNNYTDYQSGSKSNPFRLKHNTRRSLKCKKCSKSFTRIDHLKSHMLIHTGERPFKCNQCSKLFNVRSNLNDHMRTHSGERPFKCVQCSKSFTQIIHLKSHMLIHTGERPFKCNQCSKLFTVRSRLNVHMRTHSGERPFKCSQCSKSFTQKSNLKRHLRTHSSDQPL